MIKERILKLLASRISENDLSKKLIVLYKKDHTNFCSTLFMGHRTMFHLLVLNNKEHCLKKLLQVEGLQVLANNIDGNNQTILHYLAQKIDVKPGLIDFIVDKFPDLLNMQDKDGNTPLHLACKSNNINAVISLVKNPSKSGIKRNLLNLAQKKPIDLIGSNEQLKEALYYVEPMQFNLPLFTLSSPGSSADSSESSLTSRSSRGLSCSSSVDSLSESSSSASSDSLVKISQATLGAVLKQLIEAHRNDPQSTKYVTLKTYVNSLCHDIDLSRATELPPYPAPFYQILKQLYPELYDQQTRLNKHATNLLQEMVNVLICNDLLSYFPSSTTSDYKQITKENESLVQAVWLVTSGILKNDGQRLYDFKQLTDQAYNLQIMMSYDRVIDLLILLYPYFDYQQKLVANFIVLQLFISNTHNPDDTYPNKMERISHFMACNIHVEVGLGSLGLKLNAIFSRFLTIKEEVINSVLYKNNKVLGHWICSENINQLNGSFDLMINWALSHSTEERRQMVMNVADDLRLLTRQYYLLLTLDDLGQGNLSNLTRMHTNYFNRLSDFFITKILTQPTSNVVNTLQFIIELIQELSRTDQGNFIDLNQLMMLSSVLENVNVSRLNIYFDTLSKQEHKVVQYLKHLVARDLNFKAMRDVWHNERSLPFPGLIVTDLLFAGIGNSDMALRAEITGQMVSNLLKIKEELNSLPVRYHSNLPCFLDSYTMSNEDVLRHHSQCLLEIAHNFIELKAEIEEIIPTLSRLEHNYLECEVIPSVKFKGNVYEPSQLGKKLIECFKQSLNLTVRDEELEKIQLEALSKLNITLKSLVEISTRKNYECHAINPVFVLVKIKELRDLINLDKAEREHVLTFFNPEPPLKRENSNDAGASSSAPNIK